MSKSSDDKTTTEEAASGTSQRLEDVLDNLDLDTMTPPMLRTLLNYTMETLKVARRRVGEVAGVERRIAAVVGVRAALAVPPGSDDEVAVAVPVDVPHARHGKAELVVRRLAFERIQVVLSQRPRGEQGNN